MLLDRETLLRLIDEARLKDRRDLLMALIRPSIRVTLLEPVVDDSQLPAAISKIGGLPDLPVGHNWPEWHDTALSFVAQINLDDVAKYDVEGVLPQHGLLSFFYNGCQWVEGEPFEPGMWRVIYSPDMAVLRRLPAPSNFGTYNGLYIPCPINFHAEVTLPPIFSYEGFKQLGYSYSEALDPALDGFYTNVYAFMTEDYNETISRLLGYPELVQGDVFYEAQEAVFGKAERDPYDDPDSGITAWRLLFQLDSESDAEMMWGDVGRLYYCIRAADLEARAFDKTICIMQCS